MSKSYNLLGIPPNRANIKLTAPIPTAESVQTKLFQMGLTAADLQPVDWRKKGISPPRNQEDCGDCWAMSSTSTLGDRFIIQKDISGLLLEPAVTAQCVPQTMNQGCGGGQPYDAGKYFETIGIPAVGDPCPHWAKLCNSGGCTLPTCAQINQECDLTNTVMYKAKQGSTKVVAAQSGNNIDPAMCIVHIKQELLNGPVVAMYFVPNDFMASSVYKWDKTNGIYVNGAYNDVLDQVIPLNLRQQLAGQGNPPISGTGWQAIAEGGSAAHAVEIVGWDRGNAGSIGDVEYWIVKNSWGTNWMDGGYFRMAMNDGSGHNNNLGFDVPVLMGGQYFGGCVSFDPDLSTGQQHGHHYDNDFGSSSRKTIYIVAGVIGGILLLGLLYRMIKGKSNRKK